MRSQDPAFLDPRTGCPLLFHDYSRNRTTRVRAKIPWPEAGRCTAACSSAPRCPERNPPGSVALADVDGGLIVGAARVAGGFLAICLAAN